MAHRKIVKEPLNAPSQKQAKELLLRKSKRSPRNGNSSSSEVCETV